MKKLCFLLMAVVFFSCGKDDKTQFKFTNTSPGKNYPTTFYLNDNSHGVIMPGESKLVEVEPGTYRIKVTGPPNNDLLCNSTVSISEGETKEYSCP